MTEVLHLWKSDGGAPWAFAATEAEARELIRNSDWQAEPRKVEAIPGDEKFTMWYEDVPDELKSDCERNPEDLRAPDGALYDCECGGSGQVTLTAAEWCALPSKLREPVFGEFQGW